MKLYRVTVFDIYEPIKFWMTEEQVNYFRKLLSNKETEFEISRANYEILTGIAKCAK